MTHPGSLSNRPYGTYYVQGGILWRGGHAQRLLFGGAMAMPNIARSTARIDRQATPKCSISTIRLGSAPAGHDVSASDSDPIRQNLAIPELCFSRIRGVLTTSSRWSAACAGREYEHLAGTRADHSCQHD